MVCYHLVLAPEQSNGSLHVGLAQGLLDEASRENSVNASESTATSVYTPTA